MPASSPASPTARSGRARPTSISAASPSGENANHSASLPSVGTYLDEQPITTITGALDIHVFDIARVEALAGPQGTLYGASSQAGTVRIITNRPDTSSFYGAANIELNSVAHGDFGGTAEGFVNAPLSGRVALRVVAWYRRDGGYIDNIPGTLAFPTSTAIVDLPATTSPSPMTIWSRRIITTSTPMAPAPRCGSSSTTAGR